jgi:hypothetical protein
VQAAGGENKKMADETFTLDGRQFFGVKQNLTAAQDNYLLYWLGQAGATDVLLNLASGVKPESNAIALLQKILGSGYASNVLAGVLTESEKKWSRDEAGRNAKIFDDITDVGEKTIMRSALVGLVADFFLLAEVSRTTSPKSLSQNETAPATVSEAVATSELLAESSDKLPATTQSESTG